jgi:hypothetical protein
MPYAAPALVLFGLKLLVPTLGSRLLRSLSPDRVASWLAAWVIFQAVIFLVLILASIGQLLGALTIWSFVIIAAVGTWVVGRSVKPIGVIDIFKLGGVAPLVFAVLLAALAARAAIFSDFTWDAQTYELVRAALWMNYGSILVHMPTQQSAVFTYEWNGELIALAYGLVSGNLQGLMFGNVEVTLLCYVAFCWLAYRLGAPTRWAAMIGLVAAGTPATLGLGGAVKGDLLACGAFAMTVGWLTQLDSPNRTLPVAMLPMCGALALGAKLPTIIPLTIVGIVALAQMVRYLPNLRLVLPMMLGGLGAAVFLARFAINAAVYGSPYQHAESSAFGWPTLIENFKPFGYQLLHFSADNDQTSSILSGGLGTSGYFVLLALTAQGMRRIKPTLPQVWVPVGSIVAALAIASIIPYQPWTFRYYLPAVVVGMIAALSFPFDRLTVFLRSSLTALWLASVVINVAWFTRPGEANAGRSVGDLIPALLHATPLERALMQSPEILHDFNEPAGTFDRSQPLTIAVLQGVDEVISPILGSRAQNRLVFAPDIKGLTQLIVSLRPDYIVITRYWHDPANQETLSLLSQLGYKFSVGELATVGVRKDGAY